MRALVMGCLVAGLGCQSRPIKPALPAPPVVAAAMRQVGVTTKYSQQYFSLKYPGGDPPPETGACTDVVIRAFRRLGVDLQKEVHEDMRKNFDKYPRKWGLKSTDRNIDHRRVPNLMTFFARRGKALRLERDAMKPGDIITWDLPRNMTHIGLLSNEFGPSGELKIIHNIGAGVRVEDRLRDWKITGHYRWFTR